jgi:pantetheine-phosphate adenylyltransferase
MKAIFPGSFDPMTKGHVSVLKRALPLFETIYVSIGINSSKKAMFSMEQRKTWIEQVFKNEPRIEVSTYNGLTVDHCRSVGANYIIRGIRNSFDMEYERSIAQMNRDMNADIDTIFFVPEPIHSAISSTIVRDIIANGGDVAKYLPEGLDFGQ